MPAPDAFLAFAHVGDLHLREAGAADAAHWHAIVAELNATRGLFFVFLPGDNADDGRPAQYALVREGLDRLALPFHVIPGDHDMAGGDLRAFYAGLDVPSLPYAVDRGGVRCLFLDMCGAGRGGADFRLGAGQQAWLRRELAAAAGDGIACALFMHSYPADLRDAEAGAVAALIHHGPVRLVEMGHTHYNELANDGRTIYAAARSTGQVEEGPVGYALAAIDAGVVSWRFKELGAPWPVVMITAPADRRLAHDPAHAVGDRLDVRALVLGGDEGTTCDCRLGEGPWRPMARMAQTGRFQTFIDNPAGARTLAVRVRGAAGAMAVDRIELLAAPGDLPRSRGIGSDADALGAWADRGLVGTQLGPNRNGRAW